MVVGSVGRAFASDNGGPQFKPSHLQNFVITIFTVNCWKDKKNKRKRGLE